MTLMGGIATVVVVGAASIAAVSLANNADNSPKFAISKDGKTIQRIGMTGTETILEVSELPTTSAVAEGIGFRNRAFRYLAANPETERLAVVVDGTVHNWLAVYSVPKRELKEVDVFFDQSGGTPVWSEDGVHFAVSHTPGSGFKRVDVYDSLANKVVVSLTAGHFGLADAHVSNPIWTDVGRKLKVSIEEPGKASRMAEFVLSGR